MTSAREEISDHSSCALKNDSVRYRLVLRDEAARDLETYCSISPRRRTWGLGILGIGAVRWGCEGRGQSKEVVVQGDIMEYHRCRLTTFI
jgi:hypothetical protein